MYVVIARYRAAAGRADEVAALLVPLAQASRAEPGNLGYEVLRSPEDPDRFAIVEHYLDRRAFEAHIASEHYTGVAVARIRPLLAERTVDFFAPLAP